MDVGEAPLSQFDREVSHDVGGIRTVVSSLPHHINGRFALCRDVTAHDQQAIACVMIQLEPYVDFTCYRIYCKYEFPHRKLGVIDKSYLRLGNLEIIGDKLDGP